MKFMKKIKIIGALVVLVVIGGLVWYFAKSPAQQQVSRLDVIDTVGSFYNPWLNAVQQPTTGNPNRATLAASPILSKELRTKLQNVLKDPKATPDPVLCQSSVPMGISMRNVFTNDTESQVLVTSKDKTVYDQAIVRLARLNDGWYIKSIECSPGEVAPEREFTFETVGFLLKGSIPKPYDPKYWHIVYEENGQQGNVVPLLFGTKSECTSLEGVKSVCTPDQFTEATQVSVRGQMTERGADVQFLEFVK